MSWIGRWFGGRSQRPLAAAEAPQPPADREARFAEALLQLGFDHERYAQDYPLPGAPSPADLARHYDVSGRVERFAPHFAMPLPEAQARIDTLDLPEPDKDLLRLDVAAAASRTADAWGRDPERVDQLIAPSPAHRPLLVLSDSHGMLYLNEDVLRSGRLLPVPHLCTGASARGLGNPASRARAGERMRAGLSALGPRLAGGLVLLKFGQVDLEFVHDYRRIRAQTRRFDFDAAADFARDSARRYVAFARDLPALTPARLVVTAALPPALNDVALCDGYMNAHIVELHADLAPEDLRRELQQLEMPDWRTRTRLAAAFNAALADECAAAGLAFLDDFTPLVGPEGVIDPELIVWHGGTDHHLCFASPAARRAVGGFARALADS